jgi:outer membrane protein assembly factor BamB
MNQRKRTSAALALCATIFSAAQLHSQDWPQWRGPNRDGKATGFTAPDTWPQQLKQEWTATVGVGDSTPALVDGKLYTLGREDTDEIITCFDAATGKTIWGQRYPADYVVTGPPARHPGTRSSPVVADGKVCTLGVGGILSCLDAVTGKVLWRKQSANDYLGTAYRFDSSMSPLVVDGKCIVHIGGKGAGSIFAFDLASGESKWKWDGDAPASSSPVVMTVNGTKQLVTFSAKSLLALDLSNGKLLWQVPFEAKQGNNTTPVIYGETVYYTGQGKGMFALKIESHGAGFTATPLWTNSTLGARFTTPVLKDGLLYGYVRGFSCADAKTGETLWADDTGRGMSAAIVDAGPVLVASTVDSNLIVFKPGGKGYSELAKIKVADTETWATPVLAGKRIFVRDHGSVTCWSLD